MKKKDSQQYDQIDRYMRGKMSEEEECKFTSLVRTDPELREKAFSMACLWKFLRQKGMELDRMILDSVKTRYKGAGGWLLPYSDCLHLFFGAKP